MVREILMNEIHETLTALEQSDARVACRVSPVQFWIIPSAAFLSVIGTVMFTPLAAHAEVWNCSTSADVQYNWATANCRNGFGHYRVVVQCNSPRWPYTKTVYGPWRSRKSRPAGVNSSTPSHVRGENYGCHIVRAWLDI